MVKLSGMKEEAYRKEIHRIYSYVTEKRISSRRHKLVLQDDKDDTHEEHLSGRSSETLR